MTRPHTVQRPRRCSERGFTLVELLVTIVVLTVIGGAIAGAFDVGLKVMGAGGAGDRLVGSHDLSAVEQLVSQDVSRASCIAQQAGSYKTYGSCRANHFLNATVTSKCQAAVFCVGWPQVSDSTCHVAAYILTSSHLRRAEYKVSSGGAFSNVFDRAVTTGTATITLTALAPTLAPSGQQWIPSLSLSITTTDVGASNSPAQGTLLVRPLTFDPQGVGATVGTC